MIFVDMGMVLDMEIVIVDIYVSRKEKQSPHLSSWSPFVAACLTSGGNDAVSLSFLCNFMEPMVANGHGVPNKIIS